MTPVTIIALNYTCARFPPRAINSALAQTYERVEAIVVDCGQGQGHGLGLAAASGERILWLRLRGAKRRAAFASATQSRALPARAGRREGPS